MEIILELQQSAQPQHAEASVQTDRQMNRLMDGPLGVSSGLLVVGQL